MKAKLSTLHPHTSDFHLGFRLFTQLSFFEYQATNHNLIETLYFCRLNSKQIHLANLDFTSFDEKDSCLFSPLFIIGR